MEPRKMTLFYYILFITIATMVTSDDRPTFIIRSAEIVHSVNNNPDSTWKAESYGTPELDVNIFKTTRLGAKIDPHMFAERALAAENDVVDTRNTADLPTNFRWKSTKKLNCPVEKIRDQSNCGSCWAVSTAAAFSDRLCIKSEGRIRTPLSSSFIASCDSSNFGCEGGFMDKVYDFLKYNGTVTGGEYESDEGCQPYPVRPCGTKPYLMPCASAYTPKCKQNICENDWYPYKQEETMYKIESWRFLENESEARQELYENGPLTAAFIVFADFPFYKSGIYKRTPNTAPMGGHAVRVVGWGEEKGVKYWLVANSWGTDWGEKGHFRIVRGRNECEFEKQLQALTPLI